MGNIGVKNENLFNFYNGTRKAKLTNLYKKADNFWLSAFITSLF